MATSERAGRVGARRPEGSEPLEGDRPARSDAQLTRPTGHGRGPHGATVRAVTRRPDPSDERRVDPLLEVREKRRGKRPGDAYVRIVRPFEDEFQRGGDEGELIATERTVLERRGWRSGLRLLRTGLIGRPIHSEREEHERLTKVKGLAIFSSDNISSSAYGP